MCCIELCAMHCCKNQSWVVSWLPVVLQSIALFHSWNILSRGVEQPLLCSTPGHCIVCGVAARGPALTWVVWLPDAVLHYGPSTCLVLWYLAAWCVAAWCIALCGGCIATSRPVLCCMVGDTPCSVVRCGSGVHGHLLLAPQATAGWVVSCCVALRCMSTCCVTSPCCHGLRHRSRDLCGNHC